MSARAPRRNFATPFVLTLATIPACTVQTTSPPPQGPRTQESTTTTTTTHDHREEPTHVNPPRPVPEQPTTPPTTTVANPPRPSPDTSVANTGTNSQVKGTANTGPNTMVQTEPAVGPGPAPQRGYRQWTVMRIGKTCEATPKISCPPGALCNPPPPQKYTCTKLLSADGDHINVIQEKEKGDCFVDFGEFSCAPGDKCNPPKPQKVACPK